MENKRRAQGSNILIICGVIWVSYFAYFKPEALNAFWVTIVGYAWFGPGFIGILKNRTDRKSNGKDKGISE